MSRLDDRVRQRLRQLRKIQQLTQEDVAARLKWHQTRVSKYEHGSVMEMDDVDRLARVYGTTLATLLGDYTEPPVDTDFAELRAVYSRLAPKMRANFVELMQALVAVKVAR